MLHPDSDLVARAEVAAALARLAPSPVAVGTRLIDPDDAAHLFEEENVAIRNARPVRRAEFASGRALLRQMIGADVALLPRPGKGPGTPPGIRCSLSHDHRLVVAAVCTNVEVTALGIDIEPDGSLELELSAAILREDDPQINPRLALVMKEAAYKAWTDLGGGFLAHHDVRLEVDSSQPTFCAVMVECGTRLAGSWAFAADRWMALVVEGIELANPVIDQRDRSPIG